MAGPQCSRPPRSARVEARCATPAGIANQSGGRAFALTARFAQGKLAARAAEASAEQSSAVQRAGRAGNQSHRPAPRAVVATVIEAIPAAANVSSAAPHATVVASTTTATEAIVFAASTGIQSPVQPCVHGPVDAYAASRQEDGGPAAGTDCQGRSACTVCKPPAVSLIPAAAPAALSAAAQRQKIPHRGGAHLQHRNDKAVSVRRSAPRAAGSIHLATIRESNQKSTATRSASSEPAPAVACRPLSPYESRLLSESRSPLEAIERVATGTGPAASIQSPQALHGLTEGTTTATRLQGDFQALNRLRGEFQALVQWRGADVAARTERREAADAAEEMLRAENARLKAEVAELKAKLTVERPRQAVTLPDAKHARAMLASDPPATVLKPRQLSPVVEAMRLHDLLLHRQILAARLIQEEYRAYRERNHAKARLPGVVLVSLIKGQPRLQANSADPSLGAKAGGMAAGRRNVVALKAGTPTFGRAAGSNGMPSRADNSGVGETLSPRASRFFMPDTAFASDGLLAGGLGRLVGAPSPAIFNSMEREHASEIRLNAPALQDTSPRAEWLYVLTEVVGSRVDKAHDCTPERVGWRLDDFVKCDVARTAGLWREEVMAVRLHTGPMSEVYNMVLRCQRKNEFTTTIHAINSAIVKLSTQQRAAVVYRVLPIFTTPDRFFMPDTSGACVGCEASFISATADRHFAMSLIVERRLQRKVRASSNGLPETMVLCRISVTPTVQAADVSFASQKPQEEEVVFVAQAVFDVLDFHPADYSLRVTIAELRPRSGIAARTIDHVIGKMKYLHLELIHLMTEELLAAGAPEPSLLPLNGLRAECQEHKDCALFNTASGYIDHARSAFDARLNVLRRLSDERSWKDEVSQDKKVSERMLAIVGLQARAGEHEAAIEMTKLALKRSSLSEVLAAQVDEAERYAVSVTLNESVAVGSALTKPSTIKKLFPSSQHSILEGGMHFISLGLVPPWAPLAAALLARMTPASHIAFGELVRGVDGQRCGSRGSNVLVQRVISYAWGSWERGISFSDGSLVRVGESELPMISTRTLWPTDAGIGALLNEAAHRGDVALVHTLLSAKVDLRYSDARANSTLHQAVIGGHAKVCQRLLDANSNPMMPNVDGLNAWDLALRRGDNALRRIFSPSCSDIDVAGGPTPISSTSDHMHEKEYVRQLLESAKRGDAVATHATLMKAGRIKIVDTPNLMLVTPLMFAARCAGGFEAVRILLDARANTTLKTRNECSALMMAAEEGHPDSVKVLLDASLKLEDDLDQRDARGYTALHLAAENGFVEATKVLLAAGARVSIPRKNHWTCVLTAAYHGSTEVLQHLIKRSADVNAVVAGGHKQDSFSPLHLAAYSGFDKTLSELVRLGAKVNAQMGSGWSALMVAAGQGHTKATSALIAARASVDHQSPLDGATALMAAAFNPCASACVGLMLQAKANVHLHEARGLDALMLSSRIGHVQAVQQLLLQRANPGSTRAGGTTALMDAAATGAELVVKLLISAGADVRAASEEGLTALMHAAKGGHELAMLPLLQAGAYVNRTDNQSRSAVALAATRQVARRLLEAGASSTQLNEAFCAELGLQPRTPINEIKPSAAGLTGKLESTKLVRGNASSTSQSKRAPGPPGPGPTSDPKPGLTALAADDNDSRPLHTALLPLRLHPTVPDSSPLLRVYQQNASTEQLNGAVIIQERYRQMCGRREQAAKARFYMPRGSMPHSIRV